MAEKKKITARIQLKNDTSANWDKATNFRPTEGEPIVVNDNKKKIKLGDGETLAKDLPYLLDIIPIEEGEGKGSIQSVGADCSATGLNSVALGIGCNAEGKGAFAEGQETKAEGQGAHTEGTKTLATMNNGHAEGNRTKALHYNAHAEGQDTIANANSAHAEGEKTQAHTRGSHSEGIRTSAGTLSEMNEDETYKVDNRNLYEGAHAEGYETKAKGVGAHAEGRFTIAEGDASHAGGFSRPEEKGPDGMGGEKLWSAGEIRASGEGSFAHGYIYPGFAAGGASHSPGHIIASGKGAFALGCAGDYWGTGITEASGDGSFAMGKNTKAQGNYSVALGEENGALGELTMAIGKYCQAQGEGSFASGYSAFSGGEYSQAFGLGAIANANYATAFGEETLASAPAQTVVGSYNEEDNNAKFIVGVGDSLNRANAFTVGKDEEGSYITIGENRFQGLVNELGDNETVTLSQKALKELLNDIYSRLTALEPIKVSGFLYWDYGYEHIDPDFPPTNTTPYEAASVDQEINFVYNSKEYTSIHIEIIPESIYNQNIEQTCYYYTLGFVFLNKDTGDSVVANNRAVLIDFGAEKQMVSQEFYDLITKYAIFKNIDLSNSITYTITQTEKMAKQSIIGHVWSEYIDFISNGNIYTKISFNPDVSYNDDLALDIEWDYESMEPTSTTWTNEGFKTITIIDQDQLSDEFRALLEEWSS